MLRLAAFVHVPVVLLVGALFALPDTIAEQGALPGLGLSPVYQTAPTSGSLGLAVVRSEFSAAAPAPGKTLAFHAVGGSVWPSELVPLFEVEREGRTELWRRPLKGQENFTAPLFFAIAPATELESPKLAGRWQCTGQSLQRSKHYFALELTMAGDVVVGRFDQNTDYRFAQLGNGSFRSNRLTFEVTYISDRFVLSGSWMNGQIRGTWRQVDQGDEGTWEGTRLQPDPAIRRKARLVPLYEWRRLSDGSRRYSAGEGAFQEGWERAKEPLCLVWMDPNTK